MFMFGGVALWAALFLLNIKNIFLLNKDIEPYEKCFVIYKHLKICILKRFL